MVFKGSFSYISDNSGVLLSKCLHVRKKKYIDPGSLITITIKKVLPRKKIRKGQLYTAIVIRHAKVINRASGLVLKDLKNEIILLKRNEIVPLGTRIFSPICSEIRKLYLIKLLSLAPYLL